MSEQVDAIFKSIRDLESPGHDWTEEQLNDEGARKRASHDRHIFEDAKSHIKALADIINGSGNDRIICAAIVDEMFHTHRHLQGNLIVTILNALGDYGLMYKEDPMRWADARNEFAMQLLQKFRERFKDELFWRDK